jgi:hypothetical protein
MLYLLTTPKANKIMSNLVIHVTTKSTFTFTNYNKIGYILETCHNWKKVVVVSITTLKSIKSVTWSNAQPIKPIKIPLHYPLCFSADYWFRNFPRKIEIQNMFKTKLFSFSTMACKPLKLIMFQ